MLTAFSELEDFDGAIAPFLPSGWSTSTESGTSNDWVTSASSPDAGPNHAFVNDIGSISDSVLVSPSFWAPPNAQVHFRNSYNLESTGARFFDGGVLEISVGGGAYEDITANGSFVSGGYVGTIDADFSSPLAGRQAWSGDSGGYIDTTANLPASAVSQPVQLRWRLGTDVSTSDVGWSIDTVRISGDADFGDAPASYSTLLADDGAAHLAVGPTFGTLWDTEGDGQPTLAANGDDNNGGADEDGVTFAAIQVGEVNASVTVNVQYATGKLDAWIDFNNDGTFDAAGEQIAVSTDVNIGTNSILFDVPADAVSGQPLYARFRISTAGGLGPRGVALDGEVEDHTLTLDAPDFGVSLQNSGQVLENFTNTDGVELGDLNGDGDLDAFVVHSIAGGHQVWNNNGGIFSSGQTLFNSKHSEDVSLGDVDGDGDLDAFVINLTQNHQLWLNDAGVFTDSGQPLTNSASAQSVSLGDVDGDGDLDAFIAISHTAHQVWTNNGGVFTDSGQTLATSGISRAVTLGDVDEDGDLDAFVAGHADHQLWMNDGGLFTDSGQTLGNSSQSRGVELGDLDGDGDLDAIIANGTAHQVWTNNGGVFTNSQVLTNSSGSSVSLGDMDGDGDLDAFIPVFEGNHQLWTNDSGLFIESGLSLTNSASVVSAALGDVDGDGDLDVFVANHLEAHQVWTSLKADLGDAPDSYGTTKASDGARHAEVGPTLGLTRDTENDASPPLDGTGDGADEDGLTFGTVQVGQVDASVTVNVQGGAGKLDAWIDFNNDGTFDAAGEQIAVSTDVNTDDNTILFDVPADAVSGQPLFARFRLSTAGGLGPRGVALDGEVEDHTLTIDAPEFSVSLVNSGQSLTNSANSFGVQLGDIDSDGELDALVANFQGDHQVWTSNGGVFSVGQTLANTEKSISVSLGDVDGDGELDAFVASYQSNHQLWTNNAGVLVRSAQTLPNSANSQSASLGDLDGDGDLDAFVANNGSAHQVWTNNDGLFTDSGQTLANSATSLSVSLGDVDGDGDLDAFVANHEGDHQIWSNNNGMLTTGGQILSNTEKSWSVDLGDVNGDGYLDAFVATDEGNHQLWINNLGVLANSGQTLSNTSKSRNVSLADVDGDGDLDAFVANREGNHQVWTNNSGTFSNSGQTLTNSAISLGASLGDVDADGDLDAFVANSQGNHQVWVNVPGDFGDAPDSYSTTLVSNGARHAGVGPTLGLTRDTESDAVAPLDGTGDGADEDGVTFGTVHVGELDASVTVNVQGGSGKLDAWIDFNNDGTFDGVGEQIAVDVVVNTDDNTILFDVPADAVSGQPLSSRFRLSTVGGLGPRGVAPDGEVEDHAISIDAPNRSEGFIPGQTLNNSRESRSVVLGDVDGDGDLDAFVANYEGNHRVWRNRDGLFTTTQSLPNSHRSYGVSLGDVDGDGDLDAFVANSSRRDHQLWMNNDGVFGLSQTLTNPSSNSRSVTLGDVDGDGDLDAFVANRLDNHQLWINSGGEFSISGQTLTSFANSRSVKFGDVDGDGDLDAFVANDGGNHQLWKNNAGVLTDSGQILTNSARSYSVSLGDVDGDGDLDAFVANFIGNHQLWKNDAGVFTDSGQTLTNSARSRSVRLGDIDGDGDLDAFVVNQFTGHQLWTNNSGMFTNSRALTNIAVSESVSLGDIDGDGDLEAFVVNDEGNHQVWTNYGLDFGDAPDSYGTTPAKNGARHIDVGPTLGPTRDSEGDAVAPLDGTGDGADEDGVTFDSVQVAQVDASVTVNVQGATGKLDAWIDFNNDGTFDGSGEQIASSASVIPNNNTILFDVPPDAVSGQTLYARFRLSTAGGLGSIGHALDGEVEDHTVTIEAPEPSLHFGNSGQMLANSAKSRSVSLGDVDGDGDVDAFVASYQGNHQVWTNNAGVFKDSGQTLTNFAKSRSVSLGDVDGDGDLDALVANFQSSDQLWTNNGGVQNGTPGEFTFSLQLINSSRSTDIRFGDLDRDGDLDVFSVSDQQSHLLWINLGGVQGGTQGNFTPTSLFNSLRGTDASLGDLDGDGDLDAFVSIDQGNHQVWRNNGGASFNFTLIQGPLNGESSVAVALGDVNGDDDLDAFVANDQGNHQLWINNSGVFTDSGQTLANSAKSTSVSLGDVDGDGDLDAFVVNDGSAQQVWTNNGGLFTLSDQPLMNLATSREVRLGDVNGDGDLDAFVANEQNNHQVWTNAKPDFGDAPDSLGTTLISNGARHDSVGPTLGASRDVEGDAMAPLDGTGDDTDEDGVTFGTIQVGAGTATVKINLQNAATAKIDAWLDFDGNGAWDVTDQILDNVAVAGGPAILHTEYTFPVATSAVAGQTFARVRVSSAGDLEPTGFAADGEVEDYVVSIVDNLVVTLPSGAANNILVRKNGNNVEVIDQSGPTILTPIATTNSLTIVGSAVDVDHVLIDYQTGGFFVLPGGIDVQGGTGADDALMVKGTSNTQAVYSTATSPAGQTQLTVSDTGGADTVRYSDFETLVFDGMLTFEATDTLSIGTGSLTIGSTTPVDLSSLTLIAGGTLSSASPIALGPAESLIGSGTIDGPFTGEASSMIQATGVLNIGSRSSPVGFFTRGQLQTGEHTVHLLDLNQAVLGSLTTLGSASTAGILDAANGLLVDAGNNITGFGTLNTPNDPLKPLINNGAILGNSPTELITLLGHIKGVGTMDNVDVSNATLDLGSSPAAVNLGNVIYGTNSNVIIELGGTTPGSSGYDQLNHLDNVSLAGTLDVQQINNFVPSYGDVFDVVTWTGTGTGRFTGFAGMLLSNNTVAVIPKYESQRMRLVTTGPGDANLDGRVSFADFLILQNHFNQPGGITNGDFNLDGNVSFADFLVLQNAFNRVYFTNPMPAVAAADLDVRDKVLDDFDLKTEQKHGALPLINQNLKWRRNVRGAVANRRMVFDPALRDRRQRVVNAEAHIDETFAQPQELDLWVV